MASINNLHAFSNLFYFSFFVIIEIIERSGSSADSSMTKRLVVLPLHIVLFSCKQWADFDVSWSGAVNVLGIEIRKNLVYLIVRHNNLETDWMGLLTDNLVLCIEVVSLHLSLEWGLNCHVLLEEGEHELVELFWIFNAIQSDLGLSSSLTWAWAHLLLI